MLTCEPRHGTMVLVQQINELRALVDLALLLHGRAPSSALADALQDAEVAVARALATATAALSAPLCTPALVRVTAPKKGDRVLVAAHVRDVDAADPEYPIEVRFVASDMWVRGKDVVFVDPRGAQS